MKCVTSVTGLILLLCFHSLASADLLVDIDDLQLNPGGTGMVDVWLTGDDDLVGMFSFSFQITPTLGTTSTLRFTDPQPDAQLTDADYLFYGNSFGSPIGVTNVTQDLYSGGDGAFDATDATVGASKRLLARLQVEHDYLPADPLTTLGHAFTLELIPSNGSAQDETSLDTWFSNFAGDTFVDYSSLSGTITIAPTAVPEPSSLLMMLGAGAGTAWVRWRRWRRRMSLSPKPFT